MTHEDLDAFARRMWASPLNAGILVLASPILLDVAFSGVEGPTWQKAFVALMLTEIYFVPGAIIWFCWHVTFDPNDVRS
jgi:Na+(H+)/acetate symporter ActP